MKEEQKTKKQLINEIKELRQRIAELEKKEMEHKQIEIKLRESEEKYRTLTESSLTGIFIYQDGKYIFVNDKFAEIHGYKPEELIGKDPLTLIHPDDRESLKQVFLKRQRGVVISQRYEIRRIRKDGKIIWCETMSTLIRYRGRTAIMGNIVDITERKQAEEKLRESEERYASLINDAIDSLPSGIFILDRNFKIVWVNTAIEDFFGIDKNSLIGCDKRRIIKEKIKHVFEKPEQFEEIVFKTYENNTYVERYECHVLPAGRRKERFLLHWSIPIRTGALVGGRIEHYYDITQRKQAEEQIKASLKEKEVLLREIHHRVKNNMQIISSLLRLQSRYTKDKQILDIFKASQNRIETMAFIHEKLYQSKDLARVDFTDYVNTLTRNLFTTYGVSTARIKLNIDIKNVSLPLDNAIPCGLIINELVSNSLKHAFPTNKQGKIKIALHPINKNKWELIVSDNGVGIPEDIDFRNTESLGLHLVTILAEDQLRGEINLNRTEGTEFKIKFEEPRK